MKEAVTVERSARPTMISAKYRLKEERRRMLKLSVNKLRRIEDPESALRRSVLINNTVRRLQREQREARNPAPITEAMFTDVTPLRELRELREEEPVAVTAAPEAATPSQVLEELEDVLSQFYMPPTPRMITSIDEDEAGAARVGQDDDEACKRAALPSSPPRPAAATCPSPAKRPRLDRLDADDEARALADPTNTLEDFKDEVYLRTKPRVPLASAPCANSEDALRAADYCSRRYTHTGHDRENIAPYFGGLMAGEDALAAGLGGGLGGLGGLGGAAAATGVSLQLQHSLQSLQPYSCSQAHGQAQATLQSQHNLGFHGLLATMES